MLCDGLGALLLILCDLFAVRDMLSVPLKHQYGTFDGLTTGYLCAAVVCLYKRLYTHLCRSKMLI